MGLQETSTVITLPIKKQDSRAIVIGAGAVPGIETIVDIHRRWPVGWSGVDTGDDEVGCRGVAAIGSERRIEVVSQIVSLRMLTGDHLAHDNSDAEDVDLQL